MNKNGIFITRECFNPQLHLKRIKVVDLGYVYLYTLLWFEAHILPGFIGGLVPSLAILRGNWSFRRGTSTRYKVIRLPGALSSEGINVVLTGSGVVRREGCGLGMDLSGPIAWIACIKL